jgi:hypothetical protein
LDGQPSNFFLIVLLCKFALYVFQVKLSRLSTDKISLIT